MNPPNQKKPPTELFPFNELSAAHYPFTVDVADAVTREVRWRETVWKPGVLTVPGVKVNNGRPVVRIFQWPDGSVTEHYPPGCKGLTA